MGIEKEMLGGCSTMQAPTCSYPSFSAIPGQDVPLGKQKTFDMKYTYFAKGISIRTSAILSWMNKVEEDPQCRLWDKKIVVCRFCEAHIDVPPKGRAETRLALWRQHKTYCTEDKNFLPDGPIDHEQRLRNIIIQIQENNLEG
ncbi:hypothetical protein SISSUDRAFT_1044507 [Sistotremastrum suecicum HHB10207 ss-3]|uniref:Uncharacterized protein n=1 Tax=Sistotremastrum suecicum HHB10207 ss-3 TaxID=1314776 RepID=A0A166F4D7_9AGAM|nr:hypothetical protein SISSUDRAFT_1044507 [Sistotremastrum suecicum HHB10207 ss-3]